MFQYCKVSALSKLNYIFNSMLHKISFGKGRDVNVIIKFTAKTKQNSLNTLNNNESMLALPNIKMSNKEEIHETVFYFHFWKHTAQWNRKEASQ